MHLRAYLKTYVSTEVLRGLECSVLAWLVVPEGPHENSPAFQRRGHAAPSPSPGRDG